MWIDRHPYLFIYLLGCGLVWTIAIFNLALFWVLAWITKSNVLAKNLKKLQPPDEESRGAKVLAFAAALMLEAALSWVGVAAALWKTLSTLFTMLREALASTPEAIKVLRYPLRNNPTMSREAVWAYVNALGIQAGEKQPDAGQLLSLLNSMVEDHPSFDRAAALSQLGGLNVVSGSEVSSALRYLSSSAGALDEDI
jgi:hypothetical protein